MTGITDHATRAQAAAPASAESSVVERRLATILIADVFDYARLMSVDEERTVRTLRGHREVFDKLLTTHKGRYFNTAGDAILAEFPSAVDAVRCAIDIQGALRTRNERLPEGQRMWFRIGINLGDVIVQGKDLLGDGVNIAARIQSIAEPGAVCISGSIHDQIRDKLTLRFRSLGEQKFKNIAQPVRTFSISVDENAPRPLSLRWQLLSKTRLAIAAGIAALSVIAAVGSWMLRDHDHRRAEQARQMQESQRVADLKLQAEQERAAAADAQKEAALLAQLQSAKDALAKADADKQESMQRRGTDDSAPRQAKLQADLNAAREAVQKAHQRVTTAVPTPETAARVEANAPSTQVETAIPMAASPSAPVQQADPRGVERFDGQYAGQMCSPHVDNTLRCWNANLTVQHGTLSAAWPSPFSTKLARAHGTIASDGALEVSLAGFRANGGQPIAGTMSGRWTEKTITAKGAWANGDSVTGTWQWAPGAAQPDESTEAALADGTTGDDAQRQHGGGGRHRRRLP